MNLALLYRRLSGFPLGRHVFSWLVCWKAPYFGSVRPLVEKLDSGICEVSMKHRRRVTNHLGSIHAIAMCSIAELSAGLMIDASLSEGLRWIPKGMTVEYLRKAQGALLARAIYTGRFSDGDNLVDVVIVDKEQNVVLRAKITMYVSQKKAKG